MNKIYVVRKTSSYEAPCYIGACYTLQGARTLLTKSANALEDKLINWGNRPKKEVNSYEDVTALHFLEFGPLGEVTGPRHTTFEILHIDIVESPLEALANVAE